MTKCTGCRKDKDIFYFTKGDKIFKKCLDCREIAQSWREKNKERVSLYNKMTVDKRNEEKKTCNVIYARKYGDVNWFKFNTQREAAIKLGLQTSNINKVIKGHLDTTGGFQFKLVTETKSKKTVPTWDQIKTDNDILDMVKGHPSNHRINHETIDGIIGKDCCACKEWKPLTNYNNSESHWDKLRNDCKDCLAEWRKKNRYKLTQNQLIYEKNRKKTDPAFKISKTLRSRLGNAIRNQSAKKSNRTLELTGCTVSYLMGYLEAKFTEGMTWENHGEWHIDHIKPCCKFNLLDVDEQKKCFHYTNLQPLWGKDNLIKGGKFEAVDEVVDEAVDEVVVDEAVDEVEVTE